MNDTDRFKVSPALAGLTSPITDLATGERLTHQQLASLLNLTVHKLETRPPPRITVTEGTPDHERYLASMIGNRTNVTLAGAAVLLNTRTADIERLVQASRRLDIVSGYVVRAA